MAVRELGPERVVYGSDVGGRSFASQLAKVLGADIPDSAKELVAGGNLRRLLTPILRAKGTRRDHRYECLSLAVAVSSAGGR